MAITIIADSREPSGIINHLQSLGVEVTQQQLHVGDYIIDDSCIVERKSGHDFVQSLYDTRLFEQTHRMIEHYDKVVIILEDFFVDESEFRSVYGAMAYLTVRRNVPIIPSSSKEETAHIIERIASWVQEEHKDPVLSRIGPKRMTLRQRQEFLVQGLDGVGEKTASLLLDELGTPEAIFDELRSCEILYTKTGNPKGVTGTFADIRGIGHTFVIRNKKVLSAQE